MKPRALFVGHTRYQLPLPPGLQKKWNALGEHLEYVVVAAGQCPAHSDPRFELRQGRVRKLEGVTFHATLSNRLRGIIGSFRPDVVIAQSPYEGFSALVALRFARLRPKLVVEVHGDWRTAGRLYGSRLRRLVAPVAERMAIRTLKQADGTRAVGNHTARLIEEATGRAPLATFPTYTDIESFVDRPALPLPRVPTVIWIGTLERVKSPELLELAWPLVAARVPGARLVIVGAGRLQQVAVRLSSAFPDSVQWIPEVAPPEVADLLDHATVLAMTSQSEGTPRVIIEAFARSRPVVAPAVGGIPDMVADDRNGILIPSEDAKALAEALIRILAHRAIAMKLAAAASTDSTRFQWAPSEYARAVREMVDCILQQEDPVSLTVRRRPGRRRIEGRPP